MRFVLVAQYWRARGIPESRPLTTVYAAGFGTAAVCWLVSAIVPAPARFWLWGIALAIDVGTPIVTAQLTVRVPPDAAHLPERYGLFTIILLGESMVAVMKGMESQDDWTVPAALSAFLGVAIAFLLWWWYFDGANAAAERTIRSPRQARHFMVWNFAHLPLYLGIAVAGVGVEHIVSIADTGEHLHAPEAWILCSAMAVLMTALTLIGATSEAAQHDRRPARRLGPHLALAAAPLALAAAAPALPPVCVVAGLAAFCLGQVILSKRAIATPQGAAARVTLPQPG
jgi:low temperature requirement protein LtrA